MKRMLLPLLALLAIGTLAFANASFVTGQVALWCADLERAEQLAAEERWDETLRTLDNLGSLWQRRATYFHIVIHHDEIDEAEGLLAETRAFAAAQHDAEFRASAARLASQLQRLAEEEKLSLKNVL